MAKKKKTEALNCDKKVAVTVSVNKAGKCFPSKYFHKGFCRHYTRIHVVDYNWNKLQVVGILFKIFWGTLIWAIPHCQERDTTTTIENRGIWNWKLVMLTWHQGWPFFPKLIPRCHSNQSQNNKVSWEARNFLQLCFISNFVVGQCNCLYSSMSLVVHEKRLPSFVIN